ncbi:MAG TPA: hypothetical protein C5S51_03780 [Methanosarcinaceae archaeon]|nr:hypothetical protein [Methanosarcinaceae archaeon]
MKYVSSGIPGLDDILKGGFTRPSTVLIAGTAGAGKTTFAMQSVFNAARNDEVCMYVTALSEPVAMVNNFMSQFSFYNISLLARGNVKYVPVGIEIINEGIGAFASFIEDEIENIKPDRIVIDPITAIEMNLDQITRRRFYYDLLMRMKCWNALVLVTGEFNEEDLMKSELSYVSDGIIYLSNDLKNERRVRSLEVIKMRGQNPSSGKHTYSITEDGIIVYQRVQSTPHKEYTNVRVPIGVAGLDEMCGGGLLCGTSTLISGGSGTGKTLISLQFIVEGAKKGEHGIIVSFEEDEEQLKANAESIGHELGKYLESGMIRIFYSNSSELDANAHILQLESMIEEMDAKRVVVDGIYGFQPALETSMELREHIHLLANFLKSKNVTSLFINEQTELSGKLTIAGNGTSYAMDTIILLRYVEIRSEFRKAISVLKMRGSKHDKEIRELEIGDEGIEVKLPFSDFSGIMSGNPTETPGEAFVEAFKKRR